jgi:hypothetical protein
MSTPKRLVRRTVKDPSGDYTVLDLDPASTAATRPAGSRTVSMQARKARRMRREAAERQQTRETRRAVKAAPEQMINETAFREALGFRFSDWSTWKAQGKLPAPESGTKDRPLWTRSTVNGFLKRMGRQPLPSLN